MKKRITALLLALIALAALGAGCAAQTVRAADLMEGIEPSGAAEGAALTQTASAAAAAFSARLLTACADGSENVLVSPLSVLLALGMTANGASGETRAQMEQALGLSVEELNEGLAAWVGALPSLEESRVELANSIWLRDDESLTVEDAFLQANADYYGAQVYRSAFDAAAVSDVNRWVSEHTDGMIDKIIEEISEETMLYLINALTFDAEWSSVYQDVQVRSGVFTTESGSARETELMYSAERTYLEDENTTGFLKYYAGGRYAFAALLPNEELSMADYLAALDGDAWRALMDSACSAEVIAAIPKFETEYSAELGEQLQAMGMTDAFDPDRADFSAMGNVDGDPLYIGAVLHKTKITVDERGTKAGAVTAEMASGASAPAEEPKRVTLDRPFVYALIDCETALPLFIGVLADPAA